MNFKSLQFGKAMSAALFVLLLSVAGMKNALAQTQVATLQHGEDISVFYGNNAFVQAHNAAVDGDIVTLSGGSFTTPTITKAITLRGAGVVIDTVADTTPTILAGTVMFDVTNDLVALDVEGVLFTGSMKFRTLVNPKFSRCSFQEIKWGQHSMYLANAQFVNCMINNFDFTYTNTITFINSVVWNPSSLHQKTVLLYNSIFNVSMGYGNISAYNSIIINDHSTNAPESNSSFISCIGIILGSSNPFGSGYTSGCTTYASYTEVFESFIGTFSLDDSFILKDEIATGFLGTDGTQVGIHGGMMPYSNRPSYMLLKRCNVANKSTIDGKLSVDIEVVTEEE